MKRFLSRVVHPLLVLVTIPLLLLVCVVAIVLLVGCDDGGTKPLPCTTGFVLPDGFPNTIDHFGPLQYRDCDFTAEQMRSLRDTMKNTAFEVTSCLDAVYGYDFTTQNPQKGIPIPYFSKILVVNRQLDPPHTHIKFNTAGGVVTFHPVLLENGSWDMSAWAGEVHTMYRGYMLSSFRHEIVYNDDLPFARAGRLAHNTCIAKWLE